ncbi:MAG: fibrobacter succinogenes major paralogous domain-containing protein [Chitinispirillia bacterium]|nr:fibrobacter succinogenes major paralogous domain-containing protein [Chitinispirillia bacterium]
MSINKNTLIGAGVVIVFIMIAVIIFKSGLTEKRVVVNAPVLTDARDGKTYRTVIIANKRWMAENLNYAADYSFCYDNDDEICDKYGRLYDWNAAMDACPAGWVLPGRDDWNALFWAADGANFLAGRKLKSRKGWDNKGNGRDNFGFSALPGGYSWVHNAFAGIGTSGGWWSSAHSGALNMNAWGWNMYSDRTSLSENLYNNNRGLSVRCVEE